MKSLLLVLTLATAVPATAADAVCGTSDPTDRDARDLARVVAARPRVRALAAAEPTPTRMVNGFLVVPADEETAPFDDPADLEGMSFLFTPAEESKFEIRREALTYDGEVGSLFLSFGRADTTLPLKLRFEFPFGSNVYSQATLSVVRGIHFATRPTLPSRNFVAFEMLTSREPLIAPLLDYVSSPGGRPDVYVKQTDSAITITWRSQAASMAAYDVQATLFRDGRIRFSYALVRNVAWGGAVLTTGELRTVARTLLFSGSDPVGDVPSSLDESAGMLDITNVEISRINGTSILEVSVQLATAIDRDVLDPNATYTLTIGDSINRVDVLVKPDEIVYRIPRAGDLVDRGVTAMGSRIVMTIDENLLQLPARSVRAWLHTSTQEPADEIELPLELGSVPTPAELDLSASNGLERETIVETFRVPSVNLTGVWNRLQRERLLRDSEIDAVFVYTPFLSDMIYKPYGAFAMYANPGADGVSAHSSTFWPRTPTLVNMNRIGSFGDFDTKVLLHELGHRWLYYFDILESGERRRSLNPLGNHPAGFVHTPAAFNVTTPADSSAMGGARFSDLSNGSFRSPDAGEWATSFAWHELYLMGLARPQEVTPWWYIADANPTLPLEYYPPGGVTVTGTRVNVGVEQIIGAMGPRVPAYESSQKEFRTIFVILERPGQPVTPELLNPRYRTQLEEAFSRATGGRGKLRTEVPNPRRRAANK